MKNNSETKVSVKVGEQDGIPYSRADIFKLARVGGKFVLNAYQIDYMYIATRSGDDEELDLKPMPVAKIVMDKDGFEHLKKEIDSLLEVIKEQ